MSKTWVYTEGYVTCLACGKTSLGRVLTYDDGVLAPISHCPCCSLYTAYTNNLGGMFCYMRASAEKIATMNLDMMDLQDTGEER